MQPLGKLTAWLWLLMLALIAGAAEIPAPFLPAGVGVNIHFITGHQKDLDMIAEAGFKWVRMDFAWDATESKKGEYNWSTYEELLANLEQRGLRALFILDYSNPLYEDTVISPDPLTQAPRKNTESPQRPESVAAFARWSAAAAEHFRGRHVIWEIWNEPNGHFWSPNPDAQQYATLALTTCKAIRQAEPQATIIGPASAGFPWEFLETFLASGVLEYLDAVSVHPYRERQRPPETAGTDYQKLRGLIDKHTPASRKTSVPILSGEWGYSTQKGGASLETQAAFAARQQLSNLLNGIPLSIWYDWKNDGEDPNYNEHNFGTVSSDLTPKPAYVAIRALTRELSGCRIKQRLPLGSNQDYTLLCVNDATGVEKLTAWTLGEPHAVVVEIAPNTDQKLSASAGNGEHFELKPAAGRLTLQLVSAPQYVTLAVPLKRD